MEWVLGIGALLGLIGSIVGSVYTNNTNVRLTRETNELQQQLAGQANNWQEQMWQRQNAYNDPKSQVARLAGANLNPAMMMSQGGITNETGSAGSAHLPAMNVPQVQNPLEHIDPLTASQIALNAAQARKLDSDTEYQGYINAVEKELQHVPTRMVVTEVDNGEGGVKVEYGNARVEFYKRELEAAGLSVNGLRYELADLFFNLAIMNGDYSFTDSANYDPLSTEGGAAAVAALRGDQKTRELSGELAQIGKEAAEAEKSGRIAYKQWLDKHKDEPLVKFALTLQGFLQTSGISLPSFGGSSHGYTSGGVYHPTSKSWYFGKR